MSSALAVVAASGALALAMLACDGAGNPPPCTEPPGAQTLDERVGLRVGDRSFEAEVARTKVQRQRGWGRRRCGREGLVLVPDRPAGAPESGSAAAAIPIWGCQLTDPVRAAWIHDTRIVAVEVVEPCPAPCTHCSLHGEGVPAQLVIEVPLDGPELREGAVVEGLDRLGPPSPAAGKP